MLRNNYIKRFQGHRDHEFARLKENYQKKKIEKKNNSVKWDTVLNVLIYSF